MINNNLQRTRQTDMYMPLPATYAKTTVRLGDYVHLAIVRELVLGYARQGRLGTKEELLSQVLEWSPLLRTACITWLSIASPMIDGVHVYKITIDRNDQFVDMPVMSIGCIGAVRGVYTVDVNWR